MEKVKSVCRQCGKEFEHKMRKRERLFCSQLCASIERKAKKLTLICHECKKSYEILPCRKDKSFFCSLICAKAGKIKTKKYTPKGCREWTTKICEKCFKSFRHYLSRKNIARFCSQECIKRDKEIAICLHCNKNYEYMPRNRHNSIKYCSRDCHHASLTENSFWKIATEDQIYKYLEELFIKRVYKHENGCWEWLGGKYGNGYNLPFM